jgi:hypothetical protein
MPTRGGTDPDVVAELIATSKALRRQAAAAVARAHALRRPGRDREALDGRALWTAAIGEQPAPACDASSTSTPGQATHEGPGDPIGATISTG